MSLINKIDIYILKKIIPTYVINLIVITIILMLDKLFELAELIISKGVPFIMIVNLILYILPSLLALTIPMAVALSFLMVFSSLSANNEITAFYNSGIHPMKLFRYPFIFALLITIFLFYFNSFILPKSNYNAKQIYTEIHTKKPSAQIVENQFIDKIDGYRIFIEKMDYHKGELKNIIIYDYKNRHNIKTITANSGRLDIYKDKGTMSFKLFNGSIYRYNKKDKNKLIKMNFSKQSINIQYEKPTSITASKGDREYTNREIKSHLNKFKKNLKKVTKKEITLQEKIDNQNLNTREKKVLKNNYEKLKRNLTHITKKINELLVKYHKKHALAVSTIIFAFIAFPLGIITRKRKKGYSYVISIFLFLIYWISLIGGETLADRGILSPFYSMWLANIFLSFIAIYLNIIIIKGHFYTAFSFVHKFIKGIKKYVKNIKNR